MPVGHWVLLECQEQFVHHLLLAWQARFLGSGTEEKKLDDYRGRFQVTQNFHFFPPHEAPHSFRDFELGRNLKGDKEASHRSKPQAVNTMEVVCAGLPV